MFKLAYGTNEADEVFLCLLFLHEILGPNFKQTLKTVVSGMVVLPQVLRKFVAGRVQNWCLGCNMNGMWCLKAAHWHWPEK